MKQGFSLVVVALLSVLLCSQDAFSRGGGGRGGGGGGSRGGGGGMSRGGGGASRASAARPSGGLSRSQTGGMNRGNAGAGSRPSTRPQTSRPQSSRPQTSRPAAGGNRPQTIENPNFRPNSGGSGNRPNLGGNDRPNLGGGGSQLGKNNRPGGKDRPSSKDLNSFLDLPGTADKRPNNREDRKKNNIGNQIDDRENTNIGDRTKNNLVNPNTNIGDRTNNIGGGKRVGDVNINNNRQNNINNMRGRYAGGVNRPFNNNWWENQNFNPGYARWQRGWSSYPNNWCWGVATWGALNSWLPGYNFAQPMVYDYGSTVVYRDNYVYMNDQQVGTTEEYYQQAETIADSIPPVAQPDEEEWMPLGVFAVAEESATDSGMMIQLAVSKEGILAGTYYNDITDDSRPIEGMIDKKTQRAAWKFSDESNADVVFEAGVENLTKDESTCLVHFGPHKTQTWLMVRMPEAGGDDNSGQGG